jgi:hypothetical protein
MHTSSLRLGCGFTAVKEAKILHSRRHVPDATPLQRDRDTRPPTSFQKGLASRLA